MEDSGAQTTGIHSDCDAHDIANAIGNQLVTTEEEKKEFNNNLR